MHGEIKLYADQDDNVNSSALLRVGACGLEDARVNTCTYVWCMPSGKEIIETLERLLKALREGQGTKLKDESS